MVKRLDESAGISPESPDSLGIGWLVAWGVLCGWISLRFLALSGGIEFLPPVQVEGIRNYCAKLGYPKQRDYFWFLAVLFSAWGGTGIAVGARTLLRWSGWGGICSGWPARAGIACLASAFVLSFPSANEVPTIPLILAVTGLFMPWLDRGWMAGETVPDADAPHHPGSRRLILWALTAVPLVFIVVWDPGMLWRNIDGIHEGAHLLYVQSAIAGDRLGLVVRTEYAPLYDNSIVAWMRIFGLTMSAERWYFQAVQMAGTFVHIFALCWVLRTRIGSFAGFWGMLLLTIAPYTLYGATNSFRTALPFAALIACWRGLEGSKAGIMAFSGALLGIGALYSQEYAATSLMACLVMIGLVALRDGWRPAVRPFAIWTAAGLAVYLGLLLLMYGAGAGEVLAMMLTGGYASSRLYGHGARPFPSVPWIGDLATLWRVHWLLFENVVLWWPAFLSGAVGAWLIASGRRTLSGRRLLALALVAGGLATFVPAVVRPMGNMAIAGTLVPMLALCALAVDWMWERRGAGRVGAVLLVLFLAVFGCIRVWIINSDISKKWALVFTKAEPGNRLVKRLGRVMVNKPQEEGIAFLVKKIQEWCPPGKRIYMAAPGYNHLLFLADRAGLPPYPTATVAASAPARRDMVEALEREKPPLALITSLGVDIPFEDEHAEEWAYIRKNYTLAARAESLEMYRRK